VAQLWRGAFQIVGRAGPINLRAAQRARFADDLRRHIKHVVIIVQEKRSVNNPFHGFPGAGSSRSRPVVRQPFSQTASWN
jgi:phospholipase C